jgi:nucleoside-diphosphate-sugar epimerase
MRIVVTGAAGFIGSHVAERLVSLGHQVLGLDSFTPYYSRLLKDLNAAAVSAAGAELVICDLASDDLRSVLDGCEFVYHLAAQPGISARTPFSAYTRNNIDATQRLLAALEDCGTPRHGLRVLLVGYGAMRLLRRRGAQPSSCTASPSSAAEQLVMASIAACAERLARYGSFSVYGSGAPKSSTHGLSHILHQLPFPCMRAQQHRRSYT